MNRQTLGGRGSACACVCVRPDTDAEGGLAQSCASEVENTPFIYDVQFLQAIDPIFSRDNSPPSRSLNSTAMSYWPSLQKMAY